MSETTQVVPDEGMQTAPEETVIPPETASEAPVTQTDSAPEEAPKRKPATRKRKKPPDEPPAEESVPPKKPTATQQDTAPTRTPIQVRRQSLTDGPEIEIVTIDGELSIQSEQAKARDKFLDIVESLRTGRYLTDTLQGVERPDRNTSPVAILYHGDIKIIIPAEQAVIPPKDLKERTLSDVQYNMLTRRLGAEIDYVIKGVDGKAGVAAGSRMDAMRTRRHHYYFSPKEDGTYRIYDGVCAEARVVSVVTTGVFVELFGVESFIPLKEISYKRIMDANGYFKPGDRILVKVLRVERDADEQVRVALSIKQAASNPMEQAIKKIVPGNSYAGTVVMMDERGVFVALDVGAECRCKFPRRGRPPRGARVVVTIDGIDIDRFRVWGSIIHSSIPK